MKLEIEDKTFQFSYFPFFRIKQKSDYHTYGMKLPSGSVEEVMIFDLENPLNELRNYSEYLIREYVLEEDMMLTPRALELKQDLKELFENE